LVRDIDGAKIAGEEMAAGINLVQHYAAEAPRLHGGSQVSQELRRAQQALEAAGPPGQRDAETEQASIVEWLNAHPVAFDPQTCCWCGAADRSGDVVLPSGVTPRGHAWLHSGCWEPWHERRKAEALASLAGIPSSPEVAQGV
jgi:hypothetical protein